ncbi:MAG: F0F1 ATP synthase subunit alpha [Clostridiales bacterium]|nr:F0F1 ATP synthase subunit alpha [Clostridiales bacterium]
MEKPVLLVAPSCDKETIEKIINGFERKLGYRPDFDVSADARIIGGFIAIVDGNVYDMSFSSRLNETVRELGDKEGFELSEPFATVGTFLKKRAEVPKQDLPVYEFGEVMGVSDEIVEIKGLSRCRYGELIEFDGGATGLALDLRSGGISAALLDGKISTSALARATGRVANICVGEALLGRVIDPLGRPLDGKGPITADKYRPIEAPAPEIFNRAPVNRPLKTGILSVDSMIPIGRGQRELIIGDRQTGKTSIALSAIINQKAGDVYCVYCAIGQKASTVSSVVHTLERAGALDHTIVVAAFSSDTAALQYIAPYAACAIAEEFMYAGKDVLVVYDDLSKHAVAYRTMSLLLRRPSGREAYPGDVFYLHSRLLERAAQLKPELGGGSLTALPIVETTAGDISAYIPTNIISITDGQIYLETGLFNAGMRPAINVGLSVSRVGRAAQSPAMKAVSGSLRLEVAQYREMAVFAQFGADIDAATAAMLRSGERLMELLKQRPDQLFSLSEQVVLLLAVSCGVFTPYPKNDIVDTRARLLEFVHKNEPAAMQRIEETGALSESDRAAVTACFSKFLTEEGVENGARG